MVCASVVGLTVLVALLGARSAHSQDLPSLGIDADPAGNSALSVGEVDACRSVADGSTFDVDLYVEDVEELLAWEAYIGLDLAVLNIVDRDVRLFQAANAGSNVIDVSNRLPVERSPYRLGAADISDPATPDSGSGILARFTLEAVSPGVSRIDIVSLDVTDDGETDVGPFMRNVAGDPIGDTNDDGFFDGETLGAEIRVGTPCDESSSNEEGGSSEISTMGWVVIGAAASGVVLLGSAGFVLVRSLSRRSGQSAREA